MGNLLTGEAPLVIYPVEHYLTDIPHYEFDSSLGSTRFFKVARARYKEGLVVVRVFVIQDPTVPLPLKEHLERMEVIYKSLKNLPNCLPFQKHVKLDRAVILIRQFIPYSLYDRLSTRPFLTLIEKKWIAFQLLCALNQCHKVKVCHGDIKAENILMSSWNWMSLTDFASFKPTFLPYDNPADFSYFFDTSRRRICYIAPERFTDQPIADSSFHELTPAMDIFSAGCVIIEMFCDGTPPFDLAQLLNYSSKNYSPMKIIDSIPNNDIKELVEHMLQRKPELRLSAEEYLIKHRGKAFPEFFYTFFKSYAQQFAMLPIMPADDRILILHRDMDHILSSLEEEEKREKNAKLVLVVSLVTSVSRDLHFSSFRLVALKLLLRLSNHVTSDIILDRILPYVLYFAQDPLPEVRAETIRVVTACVGNLTSVPRNDANVFQDYIIPSLSHLLNDDVLQVRLTFAENIAQLAHVAVKYLDMAQAQEIREVIVQLKDQQPEKASVSETVINNKKTAEELKPEIQQVESNYDMELHQLKDLIQQKIFQLLSDQNHSVKMTLMNNGMDKLCLFFGRQKANDILLSHIVTFLNVKDDWRLRACFFTTVVDITMYVGWQCSQVLLPLLQQGLSDPEEFVITEDLRALKELTAHRLLNKTMMQTLVCDAAPLLAHPGAWVRQSAVGFITSVAKAYDIPDIHCKLVPQLRPFLTRTVLQLRKPDVILDALDSHVPRDVVDYLLRSPHLDAVFDVLTKNVNIRRGMTRQRGPAAYTELDDNLAQVFRKLTSLGMTDKIENKLLAMKDLMLKLHKNRAGSFESMSQSPGTVQFTPGSINIFHFGRLVTRRHDDLQKNRDKNAPTTPVSSGRPAKKLKKQESVNMNPEWKKMFGSDETPDTSSLSSSPPPPLSSASSMVGMRPVDFLGPPGLTPRPGSPGSVSQQGVLTTDTGGQSSLEASLQSLMTVDSFQRNMSAYSDAEKPIKSVITRYAKCKWELRDLVHHRRRQFEADVLSYDVISGIAWDSQHPQDNWKPKGMLVAHLQEHRGAINRLSLSHDHRHFTSCSNDGSVRLWEVSKLEGKTAANRSKVCLNKQGGRIKCTTFLDRANALAAASDNNSILVYKLDKGNVQVETNHVVDHEKYGQIMDLAHFDSGAHSVLCYATVSSHIVGWDLRCPSVVWSLKNDAKDGLLTSFAVNQSQSWLAAGTCSGTVVCWDMRFRMPINKIDHPSRRRVRKIAMHPNEQSWFVASFNWNSEVSMWDAETCQRQKTLWPSSAPPLSYKKLNRGREDEGICGIHMGLTESKTFVLTAGTDMRLRYWDLNYPASSSCFSHGIEDSRRLSLNYRSQLIEGSEVIQELQNVREPLDKYEMERESHMLTSSPIEGHYDTVSDIVLCQSSQALILTSSRNGHIKVWK